MHGPQSDRGFYTNAFDRMLSKYLAQQRQISDEKHIIEIFSVLMTDTHETDRYHGFTLGQVMDEAVRIFRDKVK